MPIRARRAALPRRAARSSTAASHTVHGMDVDKVRKFALQVWNVKQGEVVSLMVHLGDRLGLYKAMAGQGRMSAADLAGRTGLSERWLVEWLRCQGAAGLLDTQDGELFELSPEGSEVLADDTGSVWFAAGAFHGGVASPEVVDRLAEAFRTGRGLSYDELGPSAAHNVERMLAPWTRLVLVPRILPALEGVVDRLVAGARVVDVGCGSGVALLAMAAAFPASTFEGYDPSRYAIDRAAKEVSAHGLANVELHQAVLSVFLLILALGCLVGGLASLFKFERRLPWVRRKRGRARSSPRPRSRG